MERKEVELESHVWQISIRYCYDTSMILLRVLISSTRKKVSER